MVKSTVPGKLGIAGFALDMRGEAFSFGFDAIQRDAGKDALADDEHVMPDLPQHS